MPRISGPLYGASASGVLAGLLSFSKAGGLPAVGVPRSGRVVKSPRLLAHQAFYSDACASWSALNITEKKVYEDAAPVPLTGFKYYLSLFGSSVPWTGLTAPVSLVGFSVFSFENMMIYNNRLYLRPGFSSGFWVFSPVDLGLINQVRDRSFLFSSVGFPSGGAVLSFSVSASALVCPALVDFIPVSLVSLAAAFPDEMSCAGLFLWVRVAVSL